MDSQMIRLRDIFKSYSHQLLHLYPKQEAENLVVWLFEEYLKVKRKDIINDNTIPALPNELEIAFQNLLSGIPIQYIFEKAPFYGREFKVSPAVLIPRNETEELVHLIIQENPKTALKILDIGTGSGCIPVTLALEMSENAVWGCDISEAALEVARENAKLLDAEVDFLKLDILKDDIPFQDLDILVSNPPYIMASEKNRMHQNVVQNEPHIALFVPDRDPLLFYKQIALKGKKSLKSGGKIYFEINEAFGTETKALLEGLGYQQVRLVKDLNDKDRMIAAVFSK